MLFFPGIAFVSFVISEIRLKMVLKNVPRAVETAYHLWVPMEIIFAILNFRTNSYYFFQISAIARSRDSM